MADPGQQLYTTSIHIWSFVINVCCLVGLNNLYSRYYTIVQYSAVQHVAIVMFIVKSDGFCTCLLIACMHTPVSLCKYAQCNV